MLNKDRNKNINLLFFVFFLLLNFHGLAQKPLSLPPKFQNISLKEGLSNLSIHSITQDHMGYIWLGTARGVNRYDGINFEHFFYNEKDENSLYHDDIRVIYTNCNGKIFIATARGVNIYDPEKEQMRRALPANLAIKKFICTKQKSFALSNFGKLLIYNETNQSFDPVHDLPGDVLISDVIPDDKGNLWIKTMGETYILKYNPENKLYEKFFTPKNLELSDSDLFFKVENYIFLITSDRSFKFDIHQTKYSPLDEKFKEIEFIENADINFIERISETKIWIGTKKSGLYILDLEKAKLENYGINSTGKSLSSNHIMSIYKDCNQNVWLGTFDRGIDVAFESRKNFNFDLKLNALIGKKFVTAIESDKKGTYYFGTRFNGIIIYDSNTRTGRTLNKDNSFLTENHIRSLYVSSNSKLWISSETGSFIADLKSLKKHKVLQIPHWKQSLVCFHEASNYLFAGTDHSGLLRFKLNGDYIDQNVDFGRNIPHIVQKNDSTLLFASFGNGLHELHIKQDSVLKLRERMDLNNIIDDQIITVFKDSKNQIWAGGFVHGLLNLNFENNTSQTFTMDDGLPSNDITGITEDSFGNIWISTAYGLSKLSSNNHFTNYSYNEGLEFIQFHQKATLCDEKGTIFFGGNFGLVYFNPNVLGMDKSDPPSIILDKLNIGNQTIKPNDESQILEKTLAKTKSIVLNHRHSIFSIDYKGFDYVSATNLKYSYFLEGFDQDWNLADHRTRASYTNLRPGDYVFHVKAQNNNGKWSENPATLQIKIKPAPWLTIWAMIGYMLAVGVLLLLAFQITLRASVMKKELEIEHKERLRENEMSAMKLRFFTNISHELRTPLTLIKGNVDYINREAKSLNIRLKSIESLRNSTDRLMRLVNQILSFRQLENDALDLKIKNENIVQISRELLNSFKYNCEFKQIQLSFDCEFEELFMPLDRDKYEKILFNLLNNSLKFAESEGNIILSLEEITAQIAQNTYEAESLSGKYLQISVIDDGKGISQEKLPYIFDRYTHFSDHDYKQDYSGSGIGLHFTKRLVELHYGNIVVNSTPSVSTKFSFILPLNIDAYNQKALLKDYSEAQKPVELTKNDYASVLYEEEMPDKNDHKPVLLVAEDDVELNHFIVDSLSDRYKIISTFNGVEALKLIKNQMPDIVISDIMMPKMDGMELCKSVRENDIISHIPIILLTAKTDMENKLIGYKFGADDYITKPFEMDILKVRIKNLIVQRRKLQEFYRKASPIEFKSENVNQFEINFMNQVNTVIENNYTNSEFNVHLMAERMNMSRTSFYRKFMNIADISPKEYLTRFRINKAIELIHQGTDNFGDISFMCGFNNQSIFSVSFKKEKGITPLQYKKSI